MASLNTSELLFGMVFFKKFSDFIGTDYSELFAPSTIAEGNPNEPWAGTDLVIDEYCLQLKMSEEIYRKQNIKDAYFDGSNYFQFDVKNKPNTQNACQLDLLLALADNNAAMKVLYTAPCFDNRFNRNRGGNPEFWFTKFATSAPKDIEDFVAFFDIRTIPRALVERNNDHSIKYNSNTVRDGFGYYFSDPETIKTYVPQYSKTTLQQTYFANYDWRELSFVYKSINQKIEQLKLALRDFEKNDRILKLNGIEVIHYLASKFGIFWFPLTINHAEYRNYRIANDLEI